MGATPLFWILVVVTILLCSIDIVRGILGTCSILAFPVVAGTMWLYLYGYMAVKVGNSLDYLLPSWALAAGQLLALVCYVALLWGWYYAPEKSVRRVLPLRLSISTARRVWMGGIALFVLALIGQYTFFGQSEIDYANTTNYWYLMFYAGYPAAALCVLVLRACPAFSRPALWTLLSMLILLLMQHHIITARRGPLFPMIIVLAYVPYLTRGNRPNRAVILGSLLAAGAGMLLMVWVRPYVYRPDGAIDWTIQERLAGWGQALGSVSVEAVVSDRAVRSTDNEFLYHCGAFAVIWELGDYQYGTGYLTLLAHWIPRQWWPGKPALQQGLFESHWSEEMSGMLGWGLSRGASSGGVVNSFEQFGLLVPAVWFAVGRFARHLFDSAVVGRRPERVLQYVGFICSLHWMIAQGVGAMFVPACYYIILPTIILGWAQRATRSKVSAVLGEGRVVAPGLLPKSTSCAS